MKRFGLKWETREGKTPKVEDGPNSLDGLQGRD